jgi:hypothetical protein
MSEDRKGYLYLKDDKVHLKIGKTVNPKSRSNDYVTENLRIVRLDTMEFESEAEAESMERQLISKTKQWEITNRKNNITEWRQRKAEVIHAWIAFKEEHATVRLKEWVETKAKLLYRAKHLAETKLVDQSEVKAAADKARESFEAQLSSFRAKVSKLESIASHAEERAKQAELKNFKAACDLKQAKAQGRAEMQTELDKAIANHTSVRASFEFRHKLDQEQISRLNQELYLNKSDNLIRNSIQAARSSFDRVISYRPTMPKVTLPTINLPELPEFSSGSVVAAAVGSLAISAFTLLLLTDRIAFTF